MSYSKNTGFGFLDDLGKVVDNIVNSSGISDIFDNKSASFSTPPANVSEMAEYLQIALAVPGKQKSDFDIQVENDQLIVACTENEPEKKEENVNIIKKEFDYSTFRRSFRLDNKYDRQGISASYEQGILLIKVALLSGEYKSKIKVEVD